MSAWYRRSITTGIFATHESFKDSRRHAKIALSKPPLLSQLDVAYREAGHEFQRTDQANPRASLAAPGARRPGGRDQFLRPLGAHKGGRDREIGVWGRGGGG